MKKCNMIYIKSVPTRIRFRDTLKENDGNILPHSNPIYESCPFFLIKSAFATIYLI